MSFLGGGVALIKSTSFDILKLDDAEDVNPEMFRDFSRGYAYFRDNDISRYGDVVCFDYYTIPFEEYIKVKHDDYPRDTYIMIYSY